MLEDDKQYLKSFALVSVVVIIIWFFIQEVQFQSFTKYMPQMTRWEFFCNGNKFRINKTLED